MTDAPERIWLERVWAGWIAEESPQDDAPRHEYIRADVHAAEVARLTATPKRDDLADMQATLDYAQARHLRMLKELADAEAEVARLREAGADVWDSVATLLRMGTPADAVTSIAAQNAAALRAKS